MEEAYRLLKKCVIHVRTEDVSLDDDDEEEDGQHQVALDGPPQPEDDEEQDGRCVLIWGGQIAVTRSDKDRAVQACQ